MLNVHTYIFLLFKFPSVIFHILENNLDNNESLISMFEAQAKRNFSG